MATDIQGDILTTPDPLDIITHPEEMAFEPTDPLALDIDDKRLVKIIDKRIRASRAFFRKPAYNLYERRKKNEMYVLGRQISSKEERNELKIYESRFLDNALYEIESTIKPIAMQQMPDLIIGPNNDSNEARETAESLTKAIDTQIKSRENRIALGIAFKHMPVYFTGVIKAEWDSEKGKFGDFTFRPIHPDYIDIDHTASSPNADEMEFISELCPTTVQMVVMQFPKKRKEFFEELKKDGVMAKEIQGEDDFTESDMATPIQIRQVWFKWYEKETDKKVLDSIEDVQDEMIREPGVKWKVIRGVIWKFEKCILNKIKNPNFDYVGEEKDFVYPDPSDESSKKEVGASERFLSAALNIPLNSVTETVYRNYFQSPRVPYYLMTYDQWGKIAYDETSRIEQNLRNQQNMDKNGKNLEEAMQNKGKHVFSKESGLEAKDVEKMDMEDPTQDLIVDGDVNKTHAFISPAQPLPQSFENLDRILKRMKDLAGVSAVGGQLQSEVATSNQIGRENNFTVLDDLVENTINPASEWMAQWSMQFIKLRYTEPHMIYLLGQKGQDAFISLKSNMVNEGMVVKIKASGTDKLKAHNEAQQMWQDQAIDPINFYRDMGFDDYVERADMFVTWMMDKNGYYTKYILGLENVQQQTQALGQQPVVAPQGQPPVPTMPAMGQPQQPLPVGGPQAPTPTNTSAVPIAPPAMPQASPRSL
jgi:hypothetical protein